jgi:hypothetical protein
MRATVNVQLLLKPAASVAVNVTVVLPAPLSRVPAAGFWVITMALLGVQLSDLVTPVV